MLRAIFPSSRSRQAAESCNEAADASLGLAEHEAAARKRFEMERAMYFRRQAEVLLNLSRATIDLSVARRLRALAVEFQTKADEFEDEEADFSDMSVGCRGSSRGDIDRH
jgi:hypothetical protein